MQSRWKHPIVSLPIVSLPLMAAALVSAVGALAAGDGNSPGEVHVAKCLVALVDEARVPAEEAGVVARFLVREGSQVAAGDALAQIHDGLARLERDVADAERQVAAAKAANDVNTRYAQATNAVAQAEYDMNLEGNRKHPGTKSQVEMNKLSLVVQQSGLQIEQARQEREVAGFEAVAAASKLAVAAEHVERRALRAPISGEVVELSVHQGEWVEPGRAVLRIARLDRLRVEGFLSASDYLPSDIQNRPVRVVALLPGGRREEFTGEIVFVSPLVEAGGDWRVWAEVANRQERGRWLLRPGLEVDLTILPPSARPATNDAAANPAQ